MCFWDGQRWSVKSEKDGKVYVERVWGCDRGFEPYWTQIWLFLKTAMRFTCFARRCPLVLIVLDADFTGLWLHLCTLSLLLFHSGLLALPRLHHNFCNFDVTTMRLLELLQQRAMNLQQVCITTVSRHGMCYWDGRPWSVKSENDGKAYVERVWGYECSFEPHRTHGYGHFSRLLCVLFASIAVAPLSRTHRSRHRLHRVVAAFTCSVLAFILPQSLSSFLLMSQFFPFWCCNNETASATTAESNKLT